MDSKDSQSIKEKREAGLLVSVWLCAYCLIFDEFDLVGIGFWVRGIHRVKFQTLILSE